MPESHPVRAALPAAPLRTTSLQKWLLGLLLLWALVARLFFSWPDPTTNRIWDERYNGGNVAAIVFHDQWRPVRTHYPTLSYLPHAVVLEVYETVRSLPWLSSAPSTFWIAPNGRPLLAPRGLRMSRLIQTLLGTASLFVMFLIGQRLFGPWVGLGAAFLLAVAPWHLRQSSVFKPDVMLVLTAVLTLYAILAAQRKGSLGAYALAGAAVGATTAAKWNGAALLLPLFIAVALGGVRDIGLLVRRGAVAGAASAVVLLALNPWLVLAPEMYQSHLGSTVQLYRDRLAETGAGLFDQPLNAVTSLAGSVYFGPVLGACGLLGLVWMLVLALRRLRAVHSPLPGEQRGATAADALVLGVFFVGYVASLWIVTRFPKPPNWLIVAPIVALTGAWFIARLLNAARAMPNRRVALAALAILTVVVGFAGLERVRFVYDMAYDENVPLTSAKAARTAGRPKPLRGRTFVTELPLRTRDFAPRTWNADHVATIINTDSIPTETASERETADVLLFPASRLAPGEDPMYEQLAAGRGGATVQRFEPGPFRLRGDPVILVRQPFAALGPPELAAFSRASAETWLVDSAALRPAAEETAQVAETTEQASEVPDDSEAPDDLESTEGPAAPRLPAAPRSSEGTEVPATVQVPETGETFVSLEVAVRAPSSDEVAISVEVEGDPLPCRHTQKGNNRRRCLTARFAPPETPVRILVQPGREVVAVAAFKWRRPGLPH